jgi:hypothetical protein
VSRAVIVVLSVLCAALALSRGGGTAAASESSLRIQALPWKRVTFDRSALPRFEHGTVLLYVAAACPHCAGIATYLDSAAVADGRTLLILSADPANTMDAWRRRHGIRAGVVGDTAIAMRRALHVRAVPTMVAWGSDGTAHRVVGADRRSHRRAWEASR